MTEYCLLTCLIQSIKLMLLCHWHYFANCFIVEKKLNYLEKIFQQLFAACFTVSEYIVLLGVTSTCWTVSVKLSSISIRDTKIK